MTGDAKDPTADAVRRRLVKLDDDLRALPEDAFAAKHELLSEVDALRGVLRQIEDVGSTEVMRRWSDRSSRKSLHEQNIDMLEGLVRSKIEHGGT